MIELKNVSFGYDGAGCGSLNNITIDIRAGECAVLTGKSGCGKTTVTRLVNRLIPDFYSGKLSGFVRIAGHDTSDCEPHTLSQTVGSVFQNPRTQFFNTDTDSELVFGMENCGIEYEEMHRRYCGTVKALGLSALCRRDIFALSGGEKQRIAFGSIHALSPEIYVLDEPSANLDAAMVEKLREVLVTLKKQGKTILIAEHRLHYLNGIADRIIRMENGGITNEWTGDELSAMSNDVLAAYGMRSFSESPLVVSKSVQGCYGPALEVNNISVAYKGAGTVLSNLSFSVGTGEIVGIVGANGFGKSTLARTICGLHREKNGQILFDGKPVKPAKRHRFAYLVMQDPNYQLFCESVDAELKFNAANEKCDEAAVKGLLQALDLEGVRDHHPLALSGGQKQRLCIALAALSPAKILIFDEPTSGLDYANMMSVASILKSLSAAGKTLLIITHDNELISNVCTRAIRLSNNSKY
ncbi:energy-coupling factor transport system ATP-binding protein [Ruminiclostridium sufflavum DSM 19573]|uniref:Energy-coupling factor transport system ATP-binding protein n=1 Tax=Ruminiclostridium sufflavum DSM 19573 TaxID=1121337 RepID=A0A318XNN4_9FIRM|nr:energy-coupling factor ABC transporter ATP-binding protein [Ruminiclostridium sufflavum]PYG89740.1 energy-coupling factor transport system ATP-binding protein [Ruminiclostridium sufflavum DSM 19573]